MVLILEFDLAKSASSAESVLRTSRGDCSESSCDFWSARKWSRTGPENSGQANEDRNDRSGNRLFSTLRPETSSYYTLPGFVQGTQILQYRKRQSPIDDRNCRPSPPRKSDLGAVSGKKACFSGDFAAANGFCPHFCDHGLTLFLIRSKTRAFDRGKLL